MNERMNNFPDW